MFFYLLLFSTLQYTFFSSAYRLLTDEMSNSRCLNDKMEKLIKKFEASENNRSGHNKAPSAISFTDIDQEKTGNTTIKSNSDLGPLNKFSIKDNTTLKYIGNEHFISHLRKPALK